MGIILAGLIVAGAPGLASAQIAPVAVPTPVEKVADEVTDTVDETTRRVKKGVKKGREKASRTVDDGARMAAKSPGKTRRDLRQKETRVGTQPVAKKAATRKGRKAQSSARKKNRRDRTAQQEGPRGDRNENGDIDRLVDAGDAIEGTQVQGEQIERQPQPQREPLPSTGFEPRTLVLMGLTMIVAGMLFLTARRRPRLAPSS